MSFDAAWSSVGDIAGWLTEAQARMLYERAAELEAGARIVEIGSHHGRSTIILAYAAPNAGIVAIDPYEENVPRPQDLETFERNLARAGVAAQVHHVHATSSDALKSFDGQVDLLYIDGAHDLGTALADISNWGTLVREHGSMFVHDSFSSIGVTLAEVRALFFGRRFRYVRRSRTLVEYRRESVHGVARAANAARQATALPWFARNVLVKVALRAKLRPVARMLRHHDDVFPY